MSSLRDLLGPDEHVILQTRQHWWVLFVDAALQLLGGVIVGVAIAWASRSDWFDSHRAGGWIINALWVLLAVLVVIALWKILTWLVQRFTITTTKVVYEHGLLSRDVISVPLVKLDEVTLVQPLLGRLLRFGRLDVENAAGGKAPLAGLEFLPKPALIYRTITERARHQRLLEGGGHQDLDGDGLVDEPKKTPAAAPAGEPAPSSPEPSPTVTSSPDGPHVVTTETTTTTQTTDSATDAADRGDAGSGE